MPDRMRAVPWPAKWPAWHWSVARVPACDFSSFSPCCLVVGDSSGIVAPQPFQRGGQGLHHHAIVDMAGTQREDIVVVIPLFLEHRRHAVIGQRPVVPSFFRHIETVILFADLHP